MLYTIVLVIAKQGIPLFFDDLLGPYEKINWDGRNLKSISVIIRNDKGRPDIMMCINLDLSVLEEFQTLIQAFMQKNQLMPKPKILFKNDWQEKINQYVYSYLQEKNWHLKNLTTLQKKTIVAQLYKYGAFTGKNSAQHVSKILKISRGTVYNYLKAKINLTTDDKTS